MTTNVIVGTRMMSDELFAWFESHPRTVAYLAVVVTVWLIIEIVGAF